MKRIGQNANAELIDELYNLEIDPKEENNIIADPKNQTKRKYLETLLNDWMISINDPAL